MTFEDNYLDNLKKQFEYYKLLGDRTFSQLEDEQLFWCPNINSNSIAVIVQHLHGNMMSRFTNFLTEDGEKTWRKRDQEFENNISTREEMLKKWEEGWHCIFQAVALINKDNFNSTIYIRNIGHTVLEAMNRQLAHYAYHIGQIVFIGKVVASNWSSLSIPKGSSEPYNQEKFNKPKQKGHFTDDFIK